MAACGITLVKKFTYRGDTTEEWSNKYHFTGVDPADSTAWTALYDALCLQEKTLYASGVKIMRGYGYASDASDANNVWSKTESTGISGTFSAASAVLGQGDSSAWIRWKTSRITSPGGKPIYLRKYYHPCYHDTANMDNVAATWRTAAGTFAAKMWDGTFIDGRTLRAPGRTSETILGASVASFSTVRTLKRRGKRPTA